MGIKISQKKLTVVCDGCMNYKEAEVFVLVDLF